MFLSGSVLCVTLAAQPGLSPAIAPDGVVGSADFSSGTRVGIPRGSLFTIFGRDLAPSEARADQLPLPTALNHVRVRIWATAAASGAFTEAPLRYVSPGRIDAVLPSSVGEGGRAATVQVDERESNTAPFMVIRARFAAFAQGGLGFGPAMLQQYDPSGQVSLNRFLNPARPGQAMVLWGTGMGPYQAGSSTGLPAPAGASDEVVLYIGGVPVTPFYAGPAPGEPGVDQINFVLPLGLPERCWLPFVVRTGQLDSSVLTLSHASTAPVCRSEFGLSEAALEVLDGGGTVRAAVLSFVSDTGPQVRQTMEAWLAEYDAASLSVLAATDLRPGPEGDGGCTSRSYGYTRYNPPPPSPTPNIYGLLRLPAALALSITGSPGCFWPLTLSVEGIFRASSMAPCQASAYLFRGAAGQAKPFEVNGVLPEARPRSAIAHVGVQQSGGQLKAYWQIPSWTSADQVFLTASSSFTLHGNIFSGSTSVNELVCRAAPADGAYLFPQPAGTWAWSLPEGRAVSMSLVEVSHRVIPADESDPAPNSADFVLVRIRNGVTTLAGPD